MDKTVVSENTVDSHVFDYVIPRLVLDHILSPLRPARSGGAGIQGLGANEPINVYQILH